MMIEWFLLGIVIVAVFGVALLSRHTRGTHRRIADAGRGTSDGSMVFWGNGGSQECDPGEDGGGCDGGDGGGGGGGD